jgi:hypothetical protein
MSVESLKLRVKNRVIKISVSTSALPVACYSVFLVIAVDVRYFVGKIQKIMNFLEIFSSIILECSPPGTCGDKHPTKAFGYRLNRGSMV